MEWHSGKLFAAAALANKGGQAPPTNNVTNHKQPIFWNIYIYIYMPSINKTQLLFIK
jgi:hypothetical protein